MWPKMMQIKEPGFYFPPLSPMKYIQFILGYNPGTSFLEYPDYLEEYMPWAPLSRNFVDKVNL